MEDYRNLSAEQLQRISKANLIDFFTKLPSKDEVLMGISDKLDKLNDKFA
jgi:hypothetical protein